MGQPPQPHRPPNFPKHMVKAIEQIRQDLHKITDRVAQVKQNLETCYEDYLDGLGLSLERQLIMAAYQLCTRVYPQNFLQLSYAQREKMQQQLRHMGQEIHGNLCTVLTDPPPAEPEPEILLTKAIEVDDRDTVDKELLEVFESIDEVLADPDASTAIASPKEEEQESDNLEANQRNTELSELAERIAESLAGMVHQDEEEAIDDGSPEALVQWYKSTEKSIRQVLNQGSRKVNRLLQDATILPESVSPQVLELAIQNNHPPSSSPHASNLINLIIEADMGKKNKKRIRVTAIHLNLSELEFGDAQVSSKRGHIREQLGKIRQLKKYYKKSKKDLAIAEAEAAWRSSWHEEQ
ncbi:MAG: hypothetical protein HC799_14240 [Limnothrix sp. RL_2_0]|nr:hypothetical protein [Limnothrix sp. RL_2_0]